MAGSAWPRTVQSAWRTSLGLAAVPLALPSDRLPSSMPAECPSVRKLAAAQASTVGRWSCVHEHRWFPLCSKQGVLQPRHLAEPQPPNAQDPTQRQFSQAHFSVARSSSSSVFRLSGPRPLSTTSMRSHEHGRIGPDDSLAQQRVPHRRPHE